MRTAINPYRPIPNDPADWFSPDEVAKAKAYQKPLTRMKLLSAAVSLAALAAILGTEAAPRVADALGANGWPVRLAVVLVGLMGVYTLLELPFSAWQTFSHDREWGFSTETPGGWALDQVKGLGVGVVVNGALLYALWGLIRLSDLWWILGWIVFLLFSVLLAFLYPVVIAPIFNTFTSLEDRELADRLIGLARGAGVEVSDVQVMDASRRTRKDNAFFAGLGKTRRIVLFDNLLESPGDAIAAVVAHEVGHWRRRHIVRMVAVGTVASFLLFAGLRLVVGWEPALDLAGVESVRDPAALPLVALVFVAGNVLVGLAQKWFSRAYEREADVEALEITRDREGFQRMMRGLVTKNLADLAPSRWAYLNASHPPPAERLALSAAWADPSDRSAEGPSDRV